MTEHLASCHLCFAHRGADGHVLEGTIRHVTWQSLELSLCAHLEAVLNAAVAVYISP